MSAHPMMQPARLLPVPDAQSAPYWQAAAEGTLAIARCSRCEAFTHPPDVVCPHCRSTNPEFVFTPVSGRGKIRSWTVLRQAPLPGFVAPFLLVDVELAEQADLRLIGRLLEGPDVTLFVGDQVVVAFEELAPGHQVPAFRLAPT